MLFPFLSFFFSLSVQRNKIKIYYKVNFSSHTYKNKVIGFPYSQKTLRDFFPHHISVAMGTGYGSLWKTAYFVLA